MIITYNGTPYQILNSYTMKAYIYWDLDNPYELIASNTILEDKANRYYLMWNNNGNPTMVPQTDIEISFSEGTSRDLVTERIIAFGEKNSINDERFTTLEVDINGIKTTVGKVEEDVNGTKQTISQIEQKNDEISASVENVTKEYNLDKELQTLRDNVNIALLDLQSTVGTFLADMNTFMEDNRLSDEEAIQINDYKTIMNEERNKLNTQIDNVLTMLETQEELEEVTKLTSQKELLNNSIDNLLKNIDTVCTDKMFTNIEMTTVVSYFSNVNTKINETNTMIDNYIFLQAGGKLVEKLANLKIDQNEIVTSVSKVETNVVEINDNMKSLTSRVTSAEQKITDEAIINTVSQTYTTKTEFNNKVETMNSAIIQKANEITNMVSETYTTKSELNNRVETMTSNWTQTSNGFEARISQNEKDVSSLKLTNEEFEVTIRNKADSSNIISTINASTEGISIDSTKISISGFVTFSDLSGNGTTVINGNNITSGTISGDRISGGTISAADEINFIGGARIFGNTGEAGAGLTISASAYNFTGASTLTSTALYNNFTSEVEIDDDLTVSGSSYMANIDCSTVDCSGTVYADLLSLRRVEASGGISCSGVACSGNMSVDGTAWISTLYVNGVSVTSDTRLKTDIKYVNMDEQTTGINELVSPNVNITTGDMHEFIEDLPMISYRLIEELNHNKDNTYYGFLIQDIMYSKVGSELIEVPRDEYGNETDGYLRYSENKFIAFICGALQEEIKLRKELQERVTELENKLKEE